MGWRRWLFVFVLVAVATAPLSAQNRPPYRDPGLPAEVRALDLLGRMTLEEKFWQLYMSPGSLDDSTHDYSHGAFGLQISTGATRRPSGPADTAAEAGMIARGHAERINAIQRYFVERTRLGVPIIPFDEALHGLAREGATVFPQAIALAATFDTALASRVAEAAARETRSRGIRQALSPVVNIATDVRWGRVEETYGEDPFLTTAFGDAFVRAFEEAGVIATPKHFVANVGEGGRDSYPIEVSPRRLEEIHFPPFRSAVQHAGARSVMTAYNSVDGAPATQNRWLLTETLKQDWGFRGFVISDAAATGGATVLHHTEPNTPVAAMHAWESGLDVVFQSTWEQHRPYWQAVRDGMVSTTTVDSAVLRVLRAKFELGLFERPFVNADSAAFWNGNPSHRRLARQAAAEGMVLLKNERGLLPLTRALHTIAVIGPDATEARLGGYSGPGIHPVSILEGLRTAVGSSTRVSWVPGPGRSVAAPLPVPGEYLAMPSDSAPGVRGEYFDNNTLSGQPTLVRVDPRIDFRWTLNSPARGLAFDWYSARWTGRLRIPDTGIRRIGIEGNDGYRLWVDGQLVIDRWWKASYGAVLADAPWPAGTVHEIRLEYFESTGNARLRLIWEPAVPDESGRRIAEAVTLARTSDVAIVVAGIEEGEFRDRARLGLPGWQEQLISAVASTGTPVVVVIVGGSAVTMSRWIDNASAVLMAWYPGEAGGDAVADVLLGDVNPAGRLPVTFPIEEGQLPLVYNHKPTGRGDDYVDLTGHPLFPFGFGLSYTRFTYDSLTIEPAVVSVRDSTRVSFTLTNAGPRPGDEVAQLYLHDVLASVSRPIMELKGFQRVRLAPGESRRLTFLIPPSALTMLDADLQPVIEPGSVRVLVGASSRDIRLRGTVDVR